MYDALNPEQYDAVTRIDGPLLVLAGAGTGKTRALVTRIAHMLENGALPRQIMAVTFTNKAAGEMRERLDAMAGTGESIGVWMGTFHSICAKILRRHAESVGLRSDFTIIDGNDRLRAAKQILQDFGIDEKRWTHKHFAALLSRAKDKGLTPGQLAGFDEADFADGRLDELYKEYQQRLLSSNSADFGDLLLYCLQLFSDNAEILARYHREIKYILVDEYQDTNVVQYLWLRLLAQKSRNICCVGDDDQSIYGWRGAEVGNILRFDKDYPEAHVVRLERNYRSTANILRAASGLIAHNVDRLGKTLHTSGEPGEKVKVVLTYDDREEARFIADEIESLQLKGFSLRQCAVLVRAGAQTRSIEECFMERGLAYRVIGGLRFYERQEVRDVIAYLRLIAQDDDDFAFERVVNLPKRGVGPSTLRNVRLYARENGMSSMAALRRHFSRPCLDMRPGMQKALEYFVSQIDGWRLRMENNALLSELGEDVVRESGYAEMWRQEGVAEAQSRMENVRELLRALDRFESLYAFLEHVGLVSDGDEEAGALDQVAVMTLHAAKGLEFDAVFLPGWEEGIFPNQRSVDESGGKGLEEERRLAYVGITRARKRAYVAHSANRLYYGQVQQNLPSRFIDELPEEAIEKINMVHGAYGFPGTRRQDGTYRHNFTAEEAKSKRVVRASVAGFKVGERVYNKKYGYGTVLNIEHDKLEIFFHGVTQSKKILDKYVERAA
ncbi:MAG: UvrD-helicase domain-containing protein [Rickettsiales bacterium]